MKTKFLLVSLLISINFGLFSLSLEDLKTQALNNNPELIAEKENLSASKWDYTSSLSSMLPTASLTSAYNAFDPSKATGPNFLENTKSYGFSVNQPIFLGGKLFLSSQINKNIYEISKSSYQAKKLEILTNIENKYFKVLEAKELLTIAEKDLQSALTHEEIAKTRAQNGTISSADYLNMRSVSANKKLKLIQTKNSLDIALNDLSNYSGIKVNGNLDNIKENDYKKWIDLLSVVNAENLEQNIDKLNNASQTQNTALKIADLNISTSQKSLLLSEGSFLPSVNLSFQKNWSKANYEDAFNDQSTLVLSASLPVFPVLDNYAKYEKSRSSLKKAQFLKDNTKNSINLAVKSAFLNLISSVQSYESAKLALEYSTQTWEQKEIRYKNNLISESDMLDADILYSNAKTQYTTSIYNLLRAKSALMQLLNIEDEASLISLINNQE